MVLPLRGKININHVFRNVILRRMLTFNSFDGFFFNYCPTALYFILPVVDKWYTIKVFTDYISVFLPPDACALTLDSNTAHKNLLLSEDKRKVTWVEEEQAYPDHTERFDCCQQVLCEQGLKERCYLEMEVSEPLCVGLTYRSIGRNGDVDDCKLGQNNKSWCLICSDDGCFVQHNKEKVCVSSQCLRCSRVGVYLDWEAGTLSFYRVFSGSLIHLHTFKTTFTDPLYPAVELHTCSSVLFCQLP